MADVTESLSASSFWCALRTLWLLCKSHTGIQTDWMFWSKKLNQFCVHPDTLCPSPMQAIRICGKPHATVQFQSIYVDAECWMNVESISIFITTYTVSCSWLSMSVDLHLVLWSHRTLLYYCTREWISIGHNKPILYILVCHTKIRLFPVRLIYACLCVHI